MNQSDLSTISLKQIMQGSKKVILQHDTKPYLLSITRKGKLILTAAQDPSTTNNVPTAATR